MVMCGFAHSPMQRIMSRGKRVTLKMMVCVVVVRSTYYLRGSINKRLSRHIHAKTLCLKYDISRAYGHMLICTKVTVTYLLLSALTIPYWPLVLHPDPQLVHL